MHGIWMRWHLHQILSLARAKANAKAKMSPVGQPCELHQTTTAIKTNANSVALVCINHMEVEWKVEDGSALLGGTRPDWAILGWRTIISPQN